MPRPAKTFARAPRRRVAGALALGCLAGAVFAGASFGAACGSGDSPADAGADATFDAPGDNELTDPPDASCTAATDDIPSGVPEGWIRPPCSGYCDAFISPDSAHMRPPSPWASCGDGCFELVDDWAAPNHRIFDARGASDGKRRIISYTRDLGPSNGTEKQIVSVPENRVLFDEREPTWPENNCNVNVDAVTPASALVDLSTLPNPGRPKVHDYLVGLLSFDAMSIPHVLFEGHDYSNILETTLSPKLWAITQSRYDLQWHAMKPSNAMDLAWKSPNGGMAIDLTSHDGDIFFSVSGQTYSEIWTWNQTKGARALVSFTSPQAGAACCLQTDGKDMTWLQGSQFDGTVYQQIDLMTAPFATDAKKLKPRRLRSAFVNYVNGGVFSRVGGGYDLHIEVRNDGPEVKALVTRISDGATWDVEASPNLTWGPPLYVDAEEFSIAENATLDLAKDAGFAGGVFWTLQRRTIASLGPPTTPGDAGE